MTGTTGAGAKAELNPNATLLRDAYNLWNDTKGKSVDHWMSLLADDLKFNSLAAGAAHVAYLKAYDSKAVLRDYFDGLLKHWSMIHFTMTEYIVQGDVVIARGSCAWQNKHTNKVCNTPKMDYWRFRDGKVIEYFEYYDTAGVQAASVV